MLNEVEELGTSSSFFSPRTVNSSALGARQVVLYCISKLGKDNVEIRNLMIQRVCLRVGEHVCHVGFF